jgi:predicted nucleic acid-binding protein
MRYVLDASVAIKTVLPEQDSAKAVALKDDFVRQLHDFLAPDVFPIEVAHAISRAERRGILTPPEGSEALTDILQVLPQLHGSLSLLPRAFEISSQARIGVYDCLYLALAERENIPLITADQKLLALKGFPLLDLASF